MDYKVQSFGSPEALQGRMPQCKLPEVRGLEKKGVTGVL